LVSTRIRGQQTGQESVVTQITRSEWNCLGQTICSNNESCRTK